FQQRLQLAASYLPTSKPKTRSDRLAVSDLIKSLQNLLLGRPLGIEPAEITQATLIIAAERAVVQRARELKQLWREENGRQRVPKPVTAALVTDAMKQIAVQYGVSLSESSVQNIGRLLSKKSE